jgi:membrane protein implicated in regulation of membrane protease activity
VLVKKVGESFQQVSLNNTRGVVMIWWQWMVLGVFLLGAEIAVDAEFYLVFLGISAITLGLIGIAPMAIPIWGQWVIFSLVAIINLSLFRSRIYRRIRGQVPDRVEGVDGEIAHVDEEIASGEFGSARLRGTVWQAKNVGTTTLAQGSRAIVIGADGLILSIRDEF